MMMKKSVCIVGILVFLWIVPAIAENISCNNLEGFMEPSDTIEISSHVVGVIDEIFADRGDRVYQGQPLAKLKSNVEKVSVELANARVEFGARKVERNVDLYQKKLISQHDKDELETELKISRLQLKEAEEILKLKTITSPVTGVVVERKLTCGEYIGEGAVMTIARIDPLYIEVIVPVECYGKIKKGKKATAYLDAPIKGQYACSVKVVDQVIDAASGTFGVRLTLPNPEGRLPAGLKCRVKFY
jgi:RND family efflux transporter MFP subunit